MNGEIWKDGFQREDSEREGEVVWAGRISLLLRNHVTKEKLLHLDAQQKHANGA